MSNKNTKNQETTVSKFKVIALGGVNVRQFESFDAPIVDEIEHGATFDAVHVGPEWVTTTDGNKVRNRPYILELVSGTEQAERVMEEERATILEPAEAE